MDSDINKYLKQTESCRSDINILLLGGTGVGKSTFINSFANYLSYESLSEVHGSDLLCLIPTRFIMVDVEFQDKVIEFGEDKNEDKELGNSSTQGARAYIFNHKDGFKIRLIDTPGIGDSRGLEQDKRNFENILSYIGQFENLHAICFLLKPNESVLNAYFKFCLMHLLSRLEKSASANICFIFTNSRSTFYKPGETLAILKRVLKDIEKNPPYVKIPCSKDNMFCVDNEGFKYLVASKDPNIEFGSKEVENFSNSFYKSVEACHRLINYIRGDSFKRGLIPHVIQKTLSVNEARRVIIDLSRPLADIADLIEDNIRVLERHKKSIQSDNITIVELQSKLYIPAITIIQTPLTKPVTVCTASECSETYTVEGITKYHYKQICHNPCYLTNVPTEIIGSPELQGCWAMQGTPDCGQCGCHFTTHMHILYETKIEQVKLEDETVIVKIRTKEDMVKEQTRMIENLQVRSSAYEMEKKTISQIMAKFAHFLEKSSIVLYNDSYIDYIDYLIDRENSLGNERDRSLILRYQELKKNYEQEKHILNMALKSKKVHDRNAVLLQPKDIFSGVQSLYSLKFTGKKIKELHLQQESLRRAEHNYFMEYHCPSRQKNDIKYESDAGVSHFNEIKQKLFDLVSDLSEMFSKNKNQVDGYKKGASAKQNKGRTNVEPKTNWSDNNFQSPTTVGTPTPPLYNQNSCNNQTPYYQHNNPYNRGNSPDYQHNRPNNDHNPDYYTYNSPVYQGNPLDYQQNPHNNQRNPPDYLPYPPGNQDNRSDYYQSNSPDYQHNPPNYRRNPPNHHRNSPNYQRNLPDYHHNPPNNYRYPINYQNNPRGNQQYCPNNQRNPPDYQHNSPYNHHNPRDYYQYNPNDYKEKPPSYQEKPPNYQCNPPDYQHNPYYPQPPPSYEQQNSSNYSPAESDSKETLNEVKKPQEKCLSKGNTNNNTYEKEEDSTSESDSENKEMELVRKFLASKKKKADFIFMYKK